MRRKKLHMIALKHISLYGRIVDQARQCIGNVGSVFDRRLDSVPLLSSFTKDNHSHTVRLMKNIPNH